MNDENNISKNKYYEMIEGVFEWLKSLDSTSEKKRKDSVDALRSVVLAIRETSNYLNSKDTNNYIIEKKLSNSWTELSFKLKDLDMSMLAKKCFLKGKYWSNPEDYNSKNISQSVISLDMMEHLATKQLKAIEK